MLKITNSKEMQFALLHTLVASECQVEIYFDNESRVQICFDRGIWTVGRMQASHLATNGKLNGYFIFGDSLEIIECTDNVLKELLLARIQANKFRDDQMRAAPAWTIVDVLPAWAGSKTITEINILQPNRNGYLHADGRMRFQSE